MSYNDRIREAARWIASQPGDTWPVPRQALADWLEDAASDPGRVPWQLTEWVRETARNERRLSAECWDALDPLRSGSLDPAVVNLPLARRLPSDARIAELARLHERRRQLRRELGLR